jgi:ubiquinone biosynthesis protein Coq4
MWNPVKIYNLSKKIMARGRDDHHYDADDSQANDLIELYGEMVFPAIFITGQILRRTEGGKNILYGLEDKSEDHQLNVYIPKITDGKYLDSLAPNTVGAHYKHLINQWSFEELYNDRFQSMPKGTFIEKRRANFSRHMFLAHDFWHCIFRYDTSPLGEACIQALTHQFSLNTGPWYMSYLMAFREKRETGTWEAFKVIREAHRLGKQAKRAFYTQNYDNLLEMDIEQVRKEYNIGAPVEFYKYAEKYPSNFRFDSIHPEYNDTKISYTEATI